MRRYLEIDELRRRIVHQTFRRFRMAHVRTVAPGLAECHAVASNPASHCSIRQPALDKRRRAVHREPCDLRLTALWVCLRFRGEWGDYLASLAKDASIGTTSELIPSANVNTSMSCRSEVPSR